jgi:hypothetical protein
VGRGTTVTEKVVVHFRDGRLLKGFASHPSGGHTSIDVTPLEQKGDPVSVRFESVKAIFFVKDFTGDSTYSEHKEFAPDEPYRPGRVAFHMEDGEVLVGIVEDYQPEHSGFFLTPVDPQSNNIRCFVGAAAIKRASMA